MKFLVASLFVSFCLVSVAFAEAEDGVFVKQCIAITTEDNDNSQITSVDFARDFFNALGENDYLFRKGHIQDGLSLMKLNLKTVKLESGILQ
jgi:hypothetical protein